MVTISLENGDTITIEDNRAKSEEGLLVAGVAFAAIMVAWGGATIADKVKENKLKKLAKENEQKLKEFEQSDEYKQLMARATNLAVEFNKIHTKAISNIKSNKAVKDLFGKENIDISKYIESVKSQDEVVKDILSYTSEEIVKGHKSVESIKLSNVCYLVDIAGMCDDTGKDLYNDAFGDEMYSVLENCIPGTTNKAKYEVDVGGYGWESVTFEVMEK